MSARNRSPHPMSPVFLLGTLQQLAPAGVRIQHQLMRDTTTGELLIIISFTPLATRSAETGSWFALSPTTPPDTTTIQAIADCLIERVNPAHALTLLLDYKAEHDNAPTQTSWCSTLIRAIIAHLNDLIDLAAQELDPHLPTEALTGVPAPSPTTSYPSRPEAI